MLPLKKFLPGFRLTFMLIGGLYIFLSASILARGVAASLEPFGVPAADLNSPYYENAIWWVYTHMLIIGAVMLVIGRFASNADFKMWIARIFLVAHIYYTYLDFEAADWALDTLISEYNGFDTSLVLIHRLTNHVLDEEDILREEGKPVGLRLAKSLNALWDINYASRQENAIRGPMRPKIAALEPVSNQ